MLLKVDGLCKSFKGTPVLKNISFTVQEGEIVSLLGQSGAGKTTIVRCITGLEKADKGSIEIDGDYICKETDGMMSYAGKNELFEIRKKLGMVFQSYHLFPHMTVLENVTAALIDVRKMPKPQAREVGMSMLKTLGLEKKAGQRPFELSGGQKQRAAIARACVLNPKLSDRCPWRKMAHQGAAPPAHRPGSWQGPLSAAAPRKAGQDNASQAHPGGTAPSFPSPVFSCPPGKERRSASRPA